MKLRLKEKNWKEWAVRMGILFVGLLIAHLGVTMFLLVDLGADPFNVFVQGLAAHLPVSHGVTHMAISLGIIVVLLIVDRSYIKAGTLVCMVFGGPIIDLFSWMLSGIINGELYLPVRILILSAACIILAFGMTIVIRSEAGTGPNDLVAVVISEKSGKKFGAVRVAVDVSFVLLGMLLGGVFGVGTLVCAFVVGIAAGYFMPVSEQIVKRILKKIG